MPTRCIYWTKCKDQGNDIRDEKQESVLSDDGMSLGAGERSCSEGRRKKLMEAGSSATIWAQKGMVFLDRRRDIDVVTWCRGCGKGGGDVNPVKGRISRCVGPLVEG